MLDEKPIPEDEPDWWFGFCVRFVFGALLGAFLGFFLWAAATIDTHGGWVVIPGSAIIFGLLSGWWGDSFWHSLRYWLWWWP